MLLHTHSCKHGSTAGIIAVSGMGFVTCGSLGSNPSSSAAMEGEAKGPFPARNMQILYQSWTTPVLSHIVGLNWRLIEWVHPVDCWHGDLITYYCHQVWGLQQKIPLHLTQFLAVACFGSSNKKWDSKWNQQPRAFAFSTNRASNYVLLLYSDSLPHIKHKEVVKDAKDNKE